MSRISSNLLADTLNVVQLARETALQNGKKAQAERLNTVAGSLKTMVTNHQPGSQPSAPSGVMAQSDFQSLLAAAKGAAPAKSSAAPSATERNQVVAAMASGGMSDLDIARQMGMTRDEVKLILNVQQKYHK
jgi:DNA-binding CsgD family transcriptional regulator